jgi:hypothetical protein
MEEEYDTAMYYVNVIIGDKSNEDTLKGYQESQKGNFSQESLCGSSAEYLAGSEGSNDNIKTRQKIANI